MMTDAIATRPEDRALSLAIYTYARVYIRASGGVQGRRFCDSRDGDSLILLLSLDVVTINCAILFNPRPFFHPTLAIPGATWTGSRPKCFGFLPCARSPSRFVCGLSCVRSPPIDEGKRWIAFLDFALRFLLHAFR